jgi:hypothetical protein
MKFTSIIALAGAASAINLSAEPYPVMSGTAAAIKTDPVATERVGTTGGFDSKTLQSKTPAPESITGDFKTAYKETGVPKVLDAFNGLQDGQQFQIFSNMDGGRVIYASRVPIDTISTHPVGKYEVKTDSTQFELHIRESTGQAQEYWYWDEKTKTVRLVENGSKCFSWDHTQKALAKGVHAVVRDCEDGKDEKQGLHYVKENSHFVSDANDKLCLSTWKHNGIIGT